MEELENVVDLTKKNMEGALKHFEHALLKIRAGRASTAMVQDVMIEYYGAPTPLNQVANVAVPDAMTISIQPWDRSAIGAIEKGIINANLGFAPSNNGEYIILNVPPLTEERRKELVKQAKAECEHSKVTVRNARKDGNTDLKKNTGVSEDLIKDYEQKIQQLTDHYIKVCEQMLSAKEGDIMKV